MLCFYFRASYSRKRAKRGRNWPRTRRAQKESAKALDSSKGAAKDAFRYKSVYISIYLCLESSSRSEIKRDGKRKEERESERGSINQSDDYLMQPN